MSAYVPRKGDIVWLEFDPQSGHEQAGKRPALVVSPENYNGKVGLALFMPITSRIKGYPFEVEFATTSVSGVILADQIKSLDWKARKASFADKIPKTVLEEALAKFRLLIE